MSIRLSRLALLYLAAAVIAVGIAPSSFAQPPSPPQNEPGELRPAQPDREPGYLGLITDDRREQGTGVRVVKIVEGAPAAEAGFEVNDLIVAIEGRQVGSLDDMAAQLGPHAAGDKVRFEVRRGDLAQKIEVTLGRRPPPGERPFEFGRIPENLPEPNGAAVPQDGVATVPPRPQPFARDGVLEAAPRGQLLGIRTARVTDEVRRRLGLREPAGARVVSRVVGSPADRAQIPLDAVIVAVDNQPVASPTELARFIAAAGPGKQVALSYLAGGEQRTTVVTLADVGPPPPVDEAPLAGAAQKSAAEQIEQLERRIRELETRVQELERALRASPSAPAEKP